jgi:hypothetical protein
MSAVPSTLAVVLKDVAATYPLPVRVEPAQFDDRTEYVWVTVDGDSTVGIAVAAGLPPAERLAEAAGQLADWLVEALPGAGLPAVWPECPRHPDSHPLDPRPGPAGAVWTCPRTGEPVAAVGSLG